MQEYIILRAHECERVVGSSLQHYVQFNSPRDFLSPVHGYKTDEKTIEHTRRPEHYFLLEFVRNYSIATSRTRRQTEKAADMITGSASAPEAARGEI